MRLKPDKFNNDYTQLITYADDTLIMVRSACAHEATRKVGLKVEEVGNFLNNLGIEINAEKTKFIIFKNSKKKIYTKGKGIPELKVFNKTVKKKKELKYLGVTFNKLGNFNTQGKIMERRGKVLIGQAKNILCNKEILLKTKLMVYKMLIRASATYASSIWTTPNNIFRLQKMERWAYRYAVNLIRNPENKHFYSNEVLYETVGIEEEYIEEFIERSGRNHKLKIENHENVLVQEAYKNLYRD